MKQIIILIMQMIQLLKIFIENLSLYITKIQFKKWNIQSILNFMVI